MSDAVPVFATPSPRVRRVAVDRPWHWLSEGWSDLAFAPGVSLAFGLVAVAASFVACQADGVEVHRPQSLQVCLLALFPLQLLLGQGDE